MCGKRGGETAKQREREKKTEIRRNIMESPRITQPQQDVQPTMAKKIGLFLHALEMSDGYQSWKI